MDVKKTAKEAAEKGAKLWAAKKGFKMTGSLLKWGAVAGAGYLGYKLYKKKQGEPLSQE
ncbi:hypothetical protein [Salinimicrobium sp. GXAS 041]|uniref:hypothetical protein n=1 Tax=Salinimicrobium sp. GXAS 041 TaxID=3400806 RepID=UPI003C72AD81